MKFTFNKIFYFEIILSFLTLSFCFFFFYQRGHYKNKPYLPTISEMGTYFPENLILGTGLTFISCLFLIIILTRFYTLKIIILQEKKKKKLNILLLIIGIISSISLIFLSNILGSKNHFLHLTFASIFFISSILYLLISDIYLKILNFKISIISFVIPYICSILIFFSPYLRRWISNPTNFQRTISSLCEIISVFLIGIKFFLSIKEFPKSFLKFNKKGI